jgi:hypothetical protein
MGHPRFVQVLDFWGKYFASFYTTALGCCSGWNCIEGIAFLDHFDSHLGDSLGKTLMTQGK